MCRRITSRKSSSRKYWTPSGPSHRSSRRAVGFATVPILAPRDPSAAGLVFYAQGFVADPQGPFVGLAFTAGLQLTVGD